MSFSRLGTDGSLPQRDFSQITLTLAGANTATPFAAARAMAESVLIFATTTNSTFVGIGPTNTASYRVLNPGDEFKLPLDGSTAINLANWFAKSTDASATLVIIYQ